MKFFALLIIGICLTMHTAHGDIVATTIERFDDSAAVDNWTANEGAAVSHTPNEHGSWMQLNISRYPGEGNRWPAAARSLRAVDFLDANGIGFVFHNPTDHTQAIQVSLRDASGAAASDGHRLPPHSTVRCVSDFTRMSSMIDVAAVSSVSLYRTQPANDQCILVGEVFAARDTHATTILGELDALQRSLQTAVNQADDALPADCLTRLRQIAAHWRTRIDDPAQLVGHGTKARQELGAAFAEARSAVLREKTGRRWLVWSGHVGDPLLPREAIGDYSEPQDRIDITVLGGSYAQAVVRLTNVHHDALELLAAVESDDADVRAATMLWRAGTVLAVDGTVTADALIPLDVAGSLTVAPGETAELWLRVDAKHHAWTMGVHDAQLRLRDLRHPNQSMRVPVCIDTPDIALPPDAGLRVLLWPELFEARSDAVRGLEAQAVQNLADYGANVITLMPNEMPWPKFDAQGKLTEPIDFDLFDQRVRFHHEHMPDAMFLCWVRFDIPDPQGNFEMRSNLTPGSEAWDRGVATWLSQWQAHIESMGLDPRMFGLYLTDEPDEDELDRYRLFAPIAQEAAPLMPIYGDISEIYDDPKRTAELLDALDIIQPDATMGFERQPDMLSRLRQQADLDVWVYACRTGRRARYVNIHEYYRLAAWRAMRDGMTGIGFWAYSAAHGDPNELWNGTAAAGAGATLIYRGKDRLLMSRRWELIRESIDDARLMRLLREVDSPEARNLIDEAIDDVLAQPNDPLAPQRWRHKAIELLHR